MRFYNKKKVIINDLNLIEDFSKRDIYVVFYKSNYAFWSRWIKKWTRSDYSHCEIFVTGIKTEEDPTGFNGDCWLIGISDEQHVRALKYDSSEVTSGDKWDKVLIPSDKYSEFKEELFKWFEETKGSKYDWKGILTSNIFARRIHSENKYTCSEWLINLMDRVWPNKLYPKWFIMYTPQDVYHVVKDYIEK